MYPTGAGASGGMWWLKLPAVLRIDGPRPYQPGGFAFIHAFGEGERRHSFDSPFFNLITAHPQPTAHSMMPAGYGVLPGSDDEWCKYHGRPGVVVAGGNGPFGAARRALANMMSITAGPTSGA